MGSEAGDAVDVLSIPLQNVVREDHELDPSATPGGSCGLWVPLLLVIHLLHCGYRQTRDGNQTKPLNEALTTELNNDILEQTHPRCTGIPIIRQCSRV